MTTELTALAESVKKMRDAQKEYFRTRATSALEVSKKLEREVDQMINTIVVPAKDTQPKLF